jgi:hypothetical protein
MCPACVASAAMIVGGVTTTGGLTALAVKIFHKKPVTKTDIAESSNRVQTMRRSDYDHGIGQE